tara:strand:+ start:3277 stop:4434 length:1158 start_codon:yes stop_codon:yes gene_type:complete
MANIKSSNDPFNTVKTTATSSANAIKSKDRDVVAGDLVDKQFYTGQASDTTSVKIPIVYGTVLTKGVIIDEKTVSDIGGFTGGNEKDIINYKNYKILISEGDCNGIKSNIKNHTIINGVPLEDPDDSSIVELAGVEVKEQKTTTSSTWGASSNQFSSRSKDIDISPFKSGTTNLETSIVNKGGFLQGLADVSVTLTNNHILKFDTASDKFVSSHFNDAINDAGLYISDATAPYGVVSNPSTWVLPTAGTYTVTMATDNRKNETPFRWWKAGSNAGGAGFSVNTSNYQSSVLHLDGLARPDLLMYENSTYTFTCDNLGTNNGFYISEDSSAEITAGVESSAVATGATKTENGVFTFTPSASTPRILYYRTHAAVNTGGRILVKGIS